MTIVMKEAKLDSGLMKPGSPDVAKKKSRGKSYRTQARISQLKSNKGKWFIYAEGRKNGSGTQGALKSLTSLDTLKGVDKSKLRFEATSRVQSDGTHTIYVRYVGIPRKF